jgi:hypothetical protein
MTRVFLFLATTTALLAGALPSTAQVSVHGAIHGVVVDPDGAPVAGAEVEATDDRGASLAARTGSDGSFRLVRLVPGTYRVTIEMVGFKRHVRDGIDVRVNDVIVLGATALELGSLAEAVTVRAAAPVVSTQSSEVSLVIDSAAVDALPLNGHDFQKLTFLAPGFTGQRGNNPSTNFSASGSRDPANNYVVDGVSANDERQTAGLAPGNFGLQVPNVISTEAIQEFRVITSNADATFGRGSGAQVNVITKSGTETLRGSLYEYFRHDRFDARDFFNTGPFFDASGRAKTPPFEQHQFGGTIGGPLPVGRADRRRHFFFASIEGFRQQLEQTTSLVVPTADFVNLIPGDLGRLSRAFYFGQQVTPATGLPPGELRLLTPAERAAAVAAGFPSALFDGTPGNGEAAFALQSGTSARDYWQNAVLIRTDHRLGDRTTLSARYAFARNQLTTNTGGIAFTERTSPTKFDSLVVQAVHVLSPNQVFEARGGLLRASFISGRRVDLNPELAALGVGEFGLNVSVAGSTAFTTPSVVPAFSLSDQQLTPQFAAMHTLSRGRLTWRSGVDIRGVAVDFANNNFPTPTYTFAGLVGPNGLFGASPAQPQAVADFASATLFGAGGGPATPRREWRSTQQDYFTQADWQVRDRLTLNAGLRYSNFGVYSEAGGALANLYATDASGAIVADASPFAFGRTANTVAPVADGRPFYQPDRNNLQPRLGVVWDVAGNGRTVVRGAWGLYYDRLFQLAFSNVANNVPFATSGSVSNVEFRNNQSVPINPQIPVVFGVDPTIRNPHSHRMNVTVDRELSGATAVSVSYVGLRGRDLIRTIDPNFAGGFPPSARPDPRFSDQRILTNASWSDYDALQVLGRRRLSRGLSFTASYTLARNKDDSSADTIFSVIPTTINTGASPAPGIQLGPVVERPLDADYGYSELDVRHTFVASHLLELPFGRDRRFGSHMPRLVDAIVGGWNWSGVLVVRSGARFNVTLGSDVNDDGAFNDRPALVAGSLQDLYARGGSRTQYLLPRAEAAQRLGVPADVTDPYAPIVRNAFAGPRIAYYDMSLAKRLTAGRVAVQVEANAFNVFNRANFAPPVAALSSALFGVVTSSAAGTNPRQLQFGIKVLF